MQKEPSHQDSDPISHWPDDIKKAYEHLAIPTLYDFLLANEKLSLEIRKQDKVIKEMSEQIQSMSAQLTGIARMFDEDVEIIEIEDEDEDEDEGALAELELDLLQQEQKETNKQVSAFLMEATDSLLELSKTMKQLVGQLQTLLPKKDHTSSSTLSQLSQDLTQSIIDQVDNVRYKMMIRLEEWGIELIESQPGDPFVSEKHHALEYVIGGQLGKIARVVRVGYTKGETVLRSADVVVYGAQENKA